MLKLSERSRVLLGFVAAGALLLGALSAQAGTLYRWRTDEGTYAFTDDEKRIPKRYKQAAEAVEWGKLDDYPRYTPNNDEKVRTYSERLHRRLEHLRALNAPELGTNGQSTATAKSGVMLGSGQNGQPNIQIQPDPSSDAPVVIEDVLTKPDGKIVTRRSTVIRQGDKTLAIVKPKSNEYKLSDDVYDEDELEGR